MQSAGPRQTPTLGAQQRRRNFTLPGRPGARHAASSAGVQRCQAALGGIPDAAAAAAASGSFTTAVSHASSPPHRPPVARWPGCL